MKKIIKTLLGILTGYVIAQQLWILWQLLKNEPRQTLLERANKAPKGVSLRGTTRRFKEYTIRHAIEDGIERVSYLPETPRHATPLLLLHGMWHGAWCWERWQARLAELGWESHAFSLPGHGASPVQRPIHLCTLDYYLNFLRDEVARLGRKPVLIGHSMGGALVQWYLRYVGDDLPAVVLLTPMVAHSVLADGVPLLLKRDPAVFPLMLLTWDASPFVRTPDIAAAKLIGPRALLSPEELHARLGPESMLVLFQHNPPFWYPPENVQTPMLVVAGEEDAVISLQGLQRTAAHYQADFLSIEEAGHDLMLEHNWRESVERVHAWLEGVLSNEQ